MSQNYASPPIQRTRMTTLRRWTDRVTAAPVNTYDEAAFLRQKRVQATLHYPGATRPKSPVPVPPMNDSQTRDYMETFLHFQQVQEERIVLNIGGQCFQTSKVSMRADPGSKFGRMMRRDCPFRPAKNTYFFDRDPSHFRFILNYMRNGGHLDVSLLPREKRYLSELLSEVRFYELSGLEEIVLDRMKQVTQTRKF